MANETITQVVTNSSSIIDYITYLSKNLTNWITDITSKIGLNTTPRWSGMLLLFVSLLILYISIKISKPLIKYALLILSLLLLIGLIIPW